nr:PREDICTED: mucin-5AC-like [Paralichthys olivaceus]
MLLFLLLFLVCGSEAIFFGTMTYDPKTSNNGNVTVVIRFKLNFQSCNESTTWQCLDGSCETGAVVLNTVYSESSGEWCQTEGILTHEDPGFRLNLWLEGGNWTNNNMNGIVFWRAKTVVDLRSRSDTGQVNRSPQTTILPVLRVPSNCQRQINLLAFDPDGDEVKCRYGGAEELECNPCTPPSVLNISPTCDLSFSSTNSGNEGLYAVQLVMEDFARQTINLTSVNGTQTLNTSSPVSAIPVQFVLKVDPAVPSCTNGFYLPTFLPPTPANRARLDTMVNQTLTINIRAAANFSVISELLFSGPHNVIQTSSGPGQFTLSWTPSQSENGESHPICFVARAVLNSTKYDSEMRCVIVIVGIDPSFTTTTPAVTSTTQPPSIVDPLPLPEPRTINTTTVILGPSPVLANVTINATTTPTSTVGPSAGPEPSTINTTTTPTSTVGPSPGPEPSTISTTTTPTTTGGTTPASQQIVLRLTARVSSVVPLTDEYIVTVLQQFKNELVNYGLPPGTNLTLLRKETQPTRPQ